MSQLLRWLWKGRRCLVWKSLFKVVRRNEADAANQNAQIVHRHSHFCSIASKKSESVDGTEPFGINR